MTNEKLIDLLENISYHYSEKMECLAEWRKSGKKNKYFYGLMMSHEDWLGTYISLYNKLKNDENKSGADNPVVKGV